SRKGVISCPCPPMWHDLYHIRTHYHAERRAHRHRCSVLTHQSQTRRRFEVHGVLLAGQYPTREDIRRPHKLRHELCARSLKNVLRCAQLLDSTLAHHGHAVRHTERFVLIMRDVEKRHPDLTLNTPKLRLHSLAQLPIQSPQGLVQQEHMGLQHQCTRQGHALLLPAAELVGTACLQTGQLHQVEHGLDTSRDFRLRQASALHPQAEGDIVLYSEM